MRPVGLYKAALVNLQNLFAYVSIMLLPGIGSPPPVLVHLRSVQPLAAAQRHATIILKLRLSCPYVGGANISEVEVR